MMSCPAPEIVSQWVDGSLDPREAPGVKRHVDGCAACRRKADELRAVGKWLSQAAEPGPMCLSVEEMADILEGGSAPNHVRGCPRCAAELSALKSAEKKATRRIYRRRVPLWGWAAAAGLFAAIGLLILIIQGRPAGSDGDVVVVPPERVAPPVPPPNRAPKDLPLPPQVRPERPATVPSDKRDPLPVPPPLPPPQPETPEKPAPEPAPQQPTPVTPGRTVTAAAKNAVTLTLRSGALASLAEGKWVKPARLEEGVALRAEGRTQFDFAQARITLDGASQFTVKTDELALSEGALSADVQPGSKFELVLHEQHVVPQAAEARVLLCARPDRIVVEEGSGRWKELVLHEGVEHHVKKDRLEPQKRRTLPAAARARETLTWKMDLSNLALARRNMFHGRVEVLPEGRMIASAPTDGGFCHGQLTFHHATEDDRPLMVVKPNTAIRFRYFMTDPGHLEVVLSNATKQENFNKPLNGVVRQWTTVTLFARDIPANPGGKKVVCEVGDRFMGFGLFVGKPGTPSEVYVDQLEILEIER